MSELYYGMVMFDDLNDPSEGWASKDGKTATRIRSMHELPTDTLWWTNLPYASMYRESNAGLNPWLRMDAYLVLKPQDVLVEWGYVPKDVSPDWACEFISRVFSRIMQIAAKLLSAFRPDIPMSRQLCGTALRQDLEVLLPKGVFPSGEAATILKRGQAYAEYSRTSSRTPRGSRQIALRIPRMTYAMDLLTTPVPSGDFEFMPGRSLAGNGADRVNAVRALDRPFLAEITIQTIDPDIAPIYGFGNTMDKSDQKIIRSWVTHPEFITMANFAKLDIRNGFVGEKYEMLNLSLAEPLRDFLGDSFAHYSWSSGIIAETVWKAACLGMSGPRARTTPAGERADTSWRGAWLKGADKTASFIAANAMSDKGWPVVSYGSGTCRIAVLDEQIPDMVQDAVSQGLLPRYSDVPPNMRNSLSQWGGDSAAETFAQLLMKRDRDMLWNLDRLPLFDGKQKQAILRQMMEARKKK